MKVASKVFLFKDSGGLAIAMSYYLHPPSNSSFRLLEESFELSLNQFGIKDLKVSMLLLDKYEPPILVCAVTKVLTQVGEESSGLHTLIVPFVGVPSKLKWESKTLIRNNAKVSLYNVQVGPKMEINNTIATGTQKPPSSL